ncbi:hypothetical protein ACFXP3_26835, partial [Streptomyces sp. NPDC059096]
MPPPLPPPPSPVPPHRPSPDPDGPEGRLLTALVCAAVEPGLSGVLLFDLPPELVTPVADLFARLLDLTAGPVAGAAGASVPRTVRTVLGAATREEDLWIRPRLRRGPDHVVFSLAPGPLTEPDPGPSLAVVPDLARLGVTGMRAVVQLLGADVATVEHSGLRHRWRPRTRWLAVCRTEDTERVSPHLLDRFPVRLPVAGLRTLPSAPDDPLGPVGPLPGAWRAVLEQTAAGHPPLTVSAALAPRVLALLGPGTGHRRALALARIARALTRLDGATQVTADRAGQAARRLGRAAAAPAPAPAPPPPP